MSNFVNDRHTLYCGWVFGQALKYNIPVAPVADDDGNFTPRLRLPEVDGISIELVIPEPPEGWSLS